MHHATTATPLTPTLSGKLASLSAVAVGSFSLGSSEAAIVYINFNNLLLTDANTADTASTFHNIDINSDGTPDFRLRTRLVPSDTSQNFAAIHAPAGGTLGLIGQNVGGFNYAARLGLNAIIGNSAFFLTLTPNAVGSMALGNGFTNSQWAGAAPNNTGYLGIRFKIGADNHYGWVRVTVIPQGQPNARGFILHEAAYESTPEADILTGQVPEPGGLGLLALGATGLALHRRRRKSSQVE